MNINYDYIYFVIETYADSLIRFFLTKLLSALCESNEILNISLVKLMKMMSKIQQEHEMFSV